MKAETGEVRARVSQMNSEIHEQMPSIVTTQDETQRKTVRGAEPVGSVPVSKGRLSKDVRALSATESLGAGREGRCSCTAERSGVQRAPNFRCVLPLSPNLHGARAILHITKQKVIEEKSLQQGPTKIGKCQSQF